MQIQRRCSLRIDSHNSSLLLNALARIDARSTKELLQEGLHANAQVCVLALRAVSLVCIWADSIVKRRNDSNKLIVFV